MNFQTLKYNNTIDYNNISCDDYLKNTDYYKQYIDGYKHRKVVLKDMYRAGTSTFSDIAKIYANMNGCILPDNKLELYNVKDCSLNNYQMKKTSDIYEPGGCMIDFTEKPLNSEFTKFLDNGYNNKYREELAELERLDKEKKAWLLALENAIKTLAKTEKERSEIRAVYAKVLEESKAKNKVDETRSQLDKVNSVFESQNSENRKIGKELVTQLQSAPVRILQSKIGPIIQKLIGNKYATLLCKYTFTSGYDPYHYWIGNLKTDENVDLLRKQDASLLHDADIPYRNGQLINKVFNNGGSYNIIIEIYKRSINTPIARIGFNKFDTDDIESWFSRKNLNTDLTTVKNIANHDKFLFFSMKGHEDIKRRFFIILRYTGCNGDVGFMCIPKSTPCPWDKTYNGKIMIGKDGAFCLGSKQNGHDFITLTEKEIIDNYLGDYMTIYAVSPDNDEYQDVVEPFSQSTVVEPFSQSTVVEPFALSTPLIAGREKSSSSWKCFGWNGAPLRINERGDVECMSLNAHDCIWSGPCDSLKANPPANLKPLECGQMHLREWGGTGYDNPGNWCNTNDL
jgi:hypothetical protein